MKQIDSLIRYGLTLGCSDIHLTYGYEPMFRQNGILKLFPGNFDSRDTNDVLAEITAMSEGALSDFHEKDQRYLSKSGDTVRINIFLQSGQPACVIRLFPTDQPDIDQLSLPPILKELAALPQGLVLITGPTGCGKTTTLSAMVNVINQTRAAHIITLEDPVEYVIKNNRSLIHQREIGRDTADFQSGIRAALREDPDVILIGEMRDPETVSAALSAAETGHLVLSTLHTSGAAQTVNRIIDIFPENHRSQIRAQLAETLQGVVSQQLLPCKNQPGRIPACEVLLGTDAVRNLIRDKKTHQLNNIMATGRSLGMITFDAYLAALVTNDRVSIECAEKAASNIENLHQYLY